MYLYVGKVKNSHKKHRKSFMTHILKRRLFFDKNNSNCIVTYIVDFCKKYKSPFT